MSIYGSEIVTNYPCVCKKINEVGNGQLSVHFPERPRTETKLRTTIGAIELICCRSEIIVDRSY